MSGTSASRRVRIGISACLLGEAVRFDGGHKRDPFLTGTFARFVEWVPVCPEVECGLGTPRESMRLVGTENGIRLLTVRIAGPIHASNRAGVICPMEHGLALPAAALEIARLAVLPDRSDMAGDCPPAPNLAGVIRRSASHVVAAVPLEPSARILRMDPAIPAPGGERLGGVDTEVVEARVTAPAGESGAGEPAGGKLGAAVSHVPASEYPKTQHLAGSQLREKTRSEVTADWLGPVIDVLPLHPVGDDDSPGQSDHWSLPSRDRWRGRHDHVDDVLLRNPGDAPE